MGVEEGTQPQVLGEIIKSYDTRRSESLRDKGFGPWLREFEGEIHVGLMPTLNESEGKFVAERFTAAGKNLKDLSPAIPKNSIEGLNVAFIEGAISSDAQSSEAQKIRSNAKYVVAIGACACTGMPSASRNNFHSDEINYKIAWYMSHFDYSEKVKKLSDVIKVDDEVPGCPMTIPVFLEILNKYLKIFNII